MLVDNVKIIIKAGNGGNGAATFLRNARTARGGPDGGNGGNGGDIYFQGSSNAYDLSQFRFQKKITAEDGVRGKKKNLFGKNAESKTVFVPLGTHITDFESGKTYEIADSNPLLLAKGGKGGRGNNEFKSATNQAPIYFEKGGMGEEKTLTLELKIIAEIGLIGLPNAGKSSLLSLLTNANPKIGDYPFTTIEPNIGMLNKHTIADIPGLIEGASTGKGLGSHFLRHIEKTRIIIHCIDAASGDAQKSYETVRSEFQQYNKTLLEKPEIILITKTDLVDQEKVKEITKIFKKQKKEVLVCSIYDGKSIEILKKEILLPRPASKNTGGKKTG